MRTFRNMILKSFVPGCRQATCLLCNMFLYEKVFLDQSHTAWQMLCVNMCEYIEHVLNDHVTLYVIYLHHDAKFILIAFTVLELFSVYHL